MPDHSDAAPDVKLARLKGTEDALVDLFSILNRLGSEAKVEGDRLMLQPDPDQFELGRLSGIFETCARLNRWAAEEGQESMGDLLLLKAGIDGDPK